MRAGVTTLGTLGETLKERRRTLGLSIDEAERATRIRARLLEALENGEYDALPNPGYVRGYVSSYARFLELDPVPLLAMYKGETGARTRQELDLPHTDEAVARTGEQHAVPLRTVAIVVAAIAIVSSLVWITLRLSGDPEPLPPEPLPAEPTATAPATGPDSGEGTSEAPVDEPTQTTAATPFTLQVSVSSTGASWLRVSVDGRTAYEGTLAGGQSKRFEVTDLAVVRIGKPSVVTITRDGRGVRIPDADTPELTLRAERPEDQ